jgi:hypothetical protein
MIDPGLMFVGLMFVQVGCGVPANRACEGGGKEQKDNHPDVESLFWTGFNIDVRRWYPA